MACWILAALALSAGAQGAPLTASSSDSVDQMVVQLAAAKACDRLRGQMRALRANDRAVATGTLWIRDCRATVDHSNVTFSIAARGWRWNEQVRVLREGQVAVSDYYRFDTDITATGVLRVGYEPGTRTATVAYQPTGSASVETLPTPYEKTEAGRELAATPMRDAIIGALSLAIARAGDAPELAAPGTDVFASGLVAEIPLCIDADMFRLGTGRPFYAGVGNPRTPVELHEHGIAMFGPQRARGPVTVYVRALAGAPHAALVCQADAERVASHFLAGRADDAPELAAANVHGEARLHVDAPSCPLAIVVRATGKKTQVTWWRPAAELEHLTSPPPLACSPSR